MTEPETGRENGDPGDGDGRRGDDPGRRLVIGVMGDEGFAARIASSVVETVRAAGRTVAGADVEVDVRTASMPLNDRGEIPLHDAGWILRRRHHWDAVVYLTDLPRMTDGPGLVSDFDRQSRVVLVSVPALGVFGTRRRARQVVSEGLRVVLAARVGELEPVLINNPVEARLAPIRRTTAADAETSLFELTGLRGYLQLLAGMVRSNRPWRLLPSLSGALAAAAATGAFGLFYTSIWAMSDALSPTRLAGITLFAVAIFVTWLIGHNALWERPSGAAPARRAVLYNSFTVVTIAMGAVIVYAVLFVILLVGALAVIEAGYLESQLGHPVNVTDYLDLVWLASSLGMVAGALGSSFDDENAIRRATYSRRENERHQLIKRHDEEHRGADRAESPDRGAGRSPAAGDPPEDDRTSG